jgi:hypothetical protein
VRGQHTISKCSEDDLPPVARRSPTLALPEHAVEWLASRYPTLRATWSIVAPGSWSSALAACRRRRVRNRFRERPVTRWKTRRRCDRLTPAAWAIPESRVPSW